MFLGNLRLGLGSSARCFFFCLPCSVFFLSIAALLLLFCSLPISGPGATARVECHRCEKSTYFRTDMSYFLSSSSTCYISKGERAMFFSLLLELDEGACRIEWRDVKMNVLSGG
jgi:hypothetical protein